MEPERTQSCCKRMFLFVLFFFTDGSPALCPVRAPGCSAAAEERMQRGAGEATGQCGGCAEELNQAVRPCEARFKEFKY